MNASGLFIAKSWYTKSFKDIRKQDSFKNKSDVVYLEELIGKSNLFYISKDEKNNMYSNIFSMSPNVVISDSRFSRLNSWLQQKDILVEDINYSEISKMGGLFRCSTLPLIRE